MEINRQQFNKYLSGKVYPSNNNLSRICQYFNISEEQFNLATDEFDQIIAESFHRSHHLDSSEIEKTIATLPSSIDALNRYEGYYYSHFHALGFPDYMVRSLIHIFRDNDRFYSHNTEHLWNKKKPDAQRNRFKYKGVVLYLGDRIFITEIETLAKTTICQTILFPSYRNKVDTLSGITTGVGSINSHMPKSTRVEYQFLGKRVDIKKALAGCGIFALDDDQIDNDIRKRIDNELSDQTILLTARDS